MGSMAKSLFGGDPKQKASSKFKMTSEAKYGESEALQRFRDIASGKSPSIGQSFMNQFNDLASRQALALAASQRGSSNPMLAFRQAQLANQQMGLENSQQAAIMGQQERAAADQALLSQAAAQRGVALQSGLANQQAQIAQRGQDLQMLSGLGGAAMLMSDKEEKKDISEAKNIGKDIENLVKHLKPSNYKYKDEANGTGEKVGIMAQDLEKSKVGKTMVDTTPDGKKVVDTNKAIGALLAVAAEMNKKIEKIEKGIK